VVEVQKKYQETQDPGFRWKLRTCFPGCFEWMFDQYQNDIPQVLAFVLFIPEGANVHPGDFRRLQDLPQIPHQRTIDLLKNKRKAAIAAGKQLFLI